MNTPARRPRRAIHHGRAAGQRTPRPGPQARHGYVGRIVVSLMDRLGGHNRDRWIAQQLVELEPKQIGCTA